MKLAPFAVQYWKRFADKVFVYDNGSDDGVIEYLSSFPFIEIRHYDSDGIDDTKYIEIKNNAWKESRDVADFVVVGDFDEFVYNDDMKEYLRKMKDEGVTLMKSKWYDLISEKFPEYDENSLVHKRVRGTPNGGPKTLIFDPNKIEEINYDVGAHRCSPVGEIKNDDGNYMVYHAVNLGLGFILDKMHKRAQRLSDNNKRHGYGVHYLFSDEKITSDFYSSLLNSVEL